MTCAIPGICSGSPDCNDLLCPGRPVQLRPVPGLHTEDGGKGVSGGFGISLRMGLEPAGAQDEPIASPEDFGRWHVAAAGVLALAVAAGTVGALAYLSRCIAAAL